MREKTKVVGREEREERERPGAMGGPHPVRLRADQGVFRSFFTLMWITVGLKLRL